MGLQYGGPPRTGYHFREFTNVVQRADLTLKIEPDPEGGKDQEVTRFNYASSLQKFKQNLNNLFLLAAEEVDKAVLKWYEKIIKLKIVTQHLTEVRFSQKLINRDSSGIYHHTEFSFSNLSEQVSDKEKVLDQDVIQDYLQVADLMLFKMLDYLTGLKEDIKDINQENFPFPPDMIPDKHESSVNNPLKRFEYLVCDGGISGLRHDFEPDEEEYGYGDISYNSKTEIKTSHEIDQETGEWESYSVKFSDVLRKKLLAEYIICKSLIDEHVNALTTEERSMYFFKLTVGKLLYLLGVHTQTQSIKKYTDVEKALRGLIKFCFEKYKHFCPKPGEDETLLSILKESTHYQLPKTEVRLHLPSPRPVVFRWKDDKKAARLNTLLHTGLDSTFIQKIELVEFAKAFSGETLPAPLHVKWIDKPKSNSPVNKVTLLYLFKAMEEKGLIECKYGSEMFLRQIEYIFCDSAGEKLSNWKQSLKSVSSSKTITHRKKELDKLVSLMADEIAV